MYDVLSFSVLHDDFFELGCSNTEREYMYGLDGEEMMHADFHAQKLLMTLPEFADPFSYDLTFQDAMANTEVCKANLDVAIKAYKSPAEKMGKTLI